MAIKEGLLKLKHTVDTLAVSTAECERGFSETRRSADRAVCRQRQHKPEEPAFTPIWRLMNA